MMRSFKRYGLICSLSLGLMGSIYPTYATETKKLEPSKQTVVQDVSQDTLLKDKYYLAGNPSQWFFVMGPVGSEHQILRLQTPYSGGNILFGCDSSGKEELALTLAGLTKEDGWKGLATISLNGILHKAKIESKGVVPHQKKTTINFVDPNEIAGILNAMSNASLGRLALSEKLPQVLDHDYIYMHIDIEGYKAKIPIPPSGLAENSVKMCTRWYNDKFLTAHGFIAPDDKTHKPKAAYTPLHWNQIH